MNGPALLYNLSREHPRWFKGVATLVAVGTAIGACQGLGMLGKLVTWLGVRRGARPVRAPAGRHAWVHPSRAPGRAPRSRVEPSLQVRAPARAATCARGHPLSPRIVAGPETHMNPRSRRLDLGRFLALGGPPTWSSARVSTTRGPSPPCARSHPSRPATAAFLCAESGISNGTLENSAAYLAGWLKVLRADKRALVLAAAAASKAFDFITGTIR
jgi:hypothetical protein